MTSSYDDPKAEIAEVFFEGGRNYVHSTRLLYEFLRLLKQRHPRISEKGLHLDFFKVSSEILGGGSIYVTETQNLRLELQKTAAAEARFSFDGESLTAIFVSSSVEVGHEPGGWEQRLVHDFEFLDQMSGKACLRNVQDAADLLRGIVEVHKRSILTDLRSNGAKDQTPDIRFVYVKNLALLPDSEFIGDEIEVLVETKSLRSMAGREYTSADIVLSPKSPSGVGKICFYF